MSANFSRRLNPDAALLILSLALGVLHAWVSRYAMNPDGMSYLDVGDAFVRHDWALAVNGWWSPLYPWVIGVVLAVAKPSARLEFPIVHLVNFGVFTLSLFAFRFLLRGFFQFLRQVGSTALPEWSFSLIGYGVFLWLALEVETVYDVSPDLAVLGCFCLALGVLIRLRPGDGVWKFVILGLALGLGYWTKAIPLPLGFATLVVAYLWKYSSKNWGRGISLAAVAFLCSVAPFIGLLSHQKGRFTFGDTGGVNYAWAVSPRTKSRNWQGEEAGSGTPAHPTRQLLKHPPLFEFDGPITATYPPWADPSYWNEGLRWDFDARNQLQVLTTTVPSELRLLLRDRPELWVGIITLALLGGTMCFAGLRELWPFWVLPLMGMVLYLPLVENDRYLGGFVLVLFLAVFASVRFPPDHQKIAGYVSVAVFITMILATADYTVRIVTHHLAIPGNGPNSTTADLSSADKLKDMGIGSGAKVATIGDGTGAYWARLGKLKIVAEIMDMGHGTEEFWNPSEEVRWSRFMTNSAKPTPEWSWLHVQRMPPWR